MKIGVFDSGLGGLIITHSLVEAMPEYDFVYLGDTARVPYGSRSQEMIYNFSKQGMDFLFEHDCNLVVVACNTASSEALRRLQQEYLVEEYPDRRILGVLIPAAEAATEVTKNNRVGIIGTQATITSKAFERELKKLKADVQITSKTTPLLVPILESGETEWANLVLEKYLKSLTEAQIDTLILGCTHYPALKQNIREIVGDNVNVICQDEVVPPKLLDYLARHTDIEQRLTKKGTRTFFVTDITESMENLANKLFDDVIKLDKVDLES